MPAQHADEYNTQHQQADTYVEVIFLKHKSNRRKNNTHNGRGNKQNNTELDDGLSLKGADTPQDAGKMLYKIGYAGKCFVAGRCKSMPNQEAYASNNDDTYGNYRAGPKYPAKQQFHIGVFEAFHCLLVHWFIGSLVH